MDGTLARPRTAPLPVPDRWHRPLLALAGLMVALAAVAVVLAVVDPRPVTGQDAWFKPLKFALSIAIYAVTLAWLLGQVGRGRRLAHRAADVAAVGLVVEVVVIVGAAAVGTTSHFNVSTPLHTALWAVMGGSIVVVWVMTLLIAVLLFRTPGPDAARNLAIRAGVVLALVGMALGFLMTTPTAQQLADFQGVAGAHAVGVPDGGPGLPFLGWSTTGGDLRIPHFVGMHALQAVPLLLLALELLSRRVRVLGDVTTRRRLVLVGALTFAATVAVLTAQALAGQPVTQPAGAVLLAGTATALATAVAASLVVVTARRRLRVAAAA